MKCHSANLSDCSRVHICTPPAPAVIDSRSLRLNLMPQLSVNRRNFISHTAAALAASAILPRNALAQSTTTAPVSGMD